MFLVQHILVNGSFHYRYIEVSLVFYSFVYFLDLLDVKTILPGLKQELYLSKIVLAYLGEILNYRISLQLHHVKKTTCKNEMNKGPR